MYIRSCFSKHLPLSARKANVSALGMDTVKNYRLPPEVKAESSFTRQQSTLKVGEWGGPGMAAARGYRAPFLVCVWGIASWTGGSLMEVASSHLRDFSHRLGGGFRPCKVCPRTVMADFPHWGRYNLISSSL